MKHFFFLLLFVIPSLSFSQTNILDSTCGWDSMANQNMLAVFLSANDGVASVNVRLGSEYGSADVMNSNYTVGSTATLADNMIRIPLSNVPAGQYYVAVTITRTDASTQLLEYHSQ